MPDVIAWWKETVEREDGVVTSPVPVMVDESASPWMLVWMMATGVVAGVYSLSLADVGLVVEMVLVIARPLERSELRVAVRAAAWLSRWVCSAISMASSSCDVYSRE